MKARYYVMVSHAEAGQGARYPLHRCPVRHPDAGGLSAGGGHRRWQGCDHAEAAPPTTPLSVESGSALVPIQLEAQETKGGAVIAKSCAQLGPLEPGQDVRVELRRVFVRWARLCGPFLNPKYLHAEQNFATITKGENMLKTINASKVRQNLGKVLQEISAHNDHFLIQWRGKPTAVLISISAYETYRKQREEDLRVFDEVWERNKRFSPEEVERDVAQAIAAVRREKRAKSRARY